MTPTAIIGIDPGASGGIATLYDSGHYAAAKMPDTERDFWDLLSGIVLSQKDAQWNLVLEKVHAMPGQGVSSTFKFGQNYGMCRAFGIALGIPIHEMTPTTWQKALGLAAKIDGKTARKNAHKARAQEIFPNLTITHATADALLIAEAFRRLHP